MLNSQFTTPPFSRTAAARRRGHAPRLVSGDTEVESRKFEVEKDTNPAPVTALPALFPYRQQNRKLAHRMGCGCWVRVLGFLRPEKISLSLRGTPFFFSTRFLQPTLWEFSSRPDWSRGSSLRSFSSSLLFPGP